MNQGEGQPQGGVNKAKQGENQPTQAQNPREHHFNAMSQYYYDCYFPQLLRDKDRIQVWCLYFSVWHVCFIIVVRVYRDTRVRVDRVCFFVSRHSRSL